MAVRVSVHSNSFVDISYSRSRSIQDFDKVGHLEWLGRVVVVVMLESNLHGPQDMD